MHYRMLLLQNSLRYTYVEDRFLNTNNTLSPIPRPKHAFGGAENWNVWLKRRIVLRPTGIVPELALPQRGDVERVWHLEAQLGHSKRIQHVTISLFYHMNYPIFRYHSKMQQEQFASHSKPKMVRTTKQNVRRSLLYHRYKT